MTSQMISIYANQLRLSGALHLPKIADHQKVPLIVLLHGFVGSKVGEHRLFVKAARFFTEKGYAVFRFDFSGCGESDGDYGDVTVSKQLDEVQAALDHVSSLQQVDASQITLIGHSLGGAVAALTAAKDRRIRELILWSPVGRPYEDISTILGVKAMETVAINGLVDYQGFNVSHLFLDDLKKHQPLKVIRSFNGPAFVVHAQEDEDIPKENAARYLASLQQRRVYESASTHYITGADHTFSSYQFENELFRKSIDWLKKCEKYPVTVAL